MLRFMAGSYSLVLVMIGKSKAAHVDIIYTSRCPRDIRALSIAGVRAGNIYTALRGVPPRITTMT